MQNSLSRIEREYILKNLAEALPSLTLQQGQRFITVPASSWQMSDERIGFDIDLRQFSETLPVRVHFRHKDRALFFDSRICREGSVFFVPISADICKVVEDGRSGGMKLLVSSFEPALELRESALFPLDVVFIDPAVCSGREAVFGRLIAKLGLDSGVFRDSALACRLFEYVDSFRSGGMPSRPTLVYIDSSHALVAVPKAVFGRLKKNEVLQLALWADSRRIDCAAEIRGMMKLNAESGLLLLDLAKAQPEDKRFLHERLFRNKYQG